LGLGAVSDPDKPQPIRNIGRSLAVALPRQQEQAVKDDDQPIDTADIVVLRACIVAVLVLGLLALLGWLPGQ
jgi:CHASE3 domain sensor protein